MNLAGVLSQNRSLTHLDLSSTKIGDEGALSMVDALEGNTSLTRLGLSDNLISGQKPQLETPEKHIPHSHRPFSPE